jgi:hypothetical protein
MYCDNLTLAGILSVLAIVVFMLRLPRYPDERPCCGA